MCILKCKNIFKIINSGLEKVKNNIYFFNEFEWVQEKNYSYSIL